MPTNKLKKFLEEQVSFLAHMDKEMVTDEYVTMGDIDDSHLLLHSDDRKRKTCSRVLTGPAVRIRD